MDLEESKILIPHSKSGKPRLVPYDHYTTGLALARWLMQRKRLRHSGQAALWLSFKGPLTYSGIKIIIDARCAAVGADLTAHAFRRGFAIDWLRRGGTEQGLKSVAGWSSGLMVERYTRSAKAELAIEERRGMYAARR